MGYLISGSLSVTTAIGSGRTNTGGCTGLLAIGTSGHAYEVILVGGASRPFEVVGHIGEAQFQALLASGHEFPPAAQPGAQFRAGEHGLFEGIGRPLRRSDADLAPHAHEVRRARTPEVLVAVHELERSAVVYHVKQHTGWDICGTERITPLFQYGKRR